MTSRPLGSTSRSMKTATGDNWPAPAAGRSGARGRRLPDRLGSRDPDLRDRWTLKLPGNALKDRYAKGTAPSMANFRLFRAGPFEIAQLCQGDGHPKVRLGQKARYSRPM